MIKRFQLWLYPELKHYGGYLARQRALWGASGRAMKQPKIWMSYLALIAFVIAFLIFIVKVDQFHFILDFPGFSLLFGLSFGAFVGYIQCGAIRREMRIDLRFKGLPICVRCGYDLTSIENSLCSECGFDNYASIDEANTTA